VAKGYMKKEGVNYHKTLSLVCRKDSFRIIMTFVAHFDLELHHMHMKTTLLNKDLEEEVYMNQPKVFCDDTNGHLVCKLKKSIYGLKQASRQWYIKFYNVIISYDFIENVIDQYIYLKVNEREYIFFVSYI
jgi:hypothetical protein